MALPWNPNSPTVFGFEHDILRHGRTKLETFSSAFVQKLQSQTTEVVQYIGLGFPLPISEGFGPTDPDIEMPTIIDVYSGETPPTGLVLTKDSFTPNAFTDRVGWVDQAGATATLHARIDEPPDNPDYSDYIFDATVGSTHKVDFQFGTAAWPAGRRVLDVRVRARVRGGDIGFSLVQAGGSSAEVRTGYTGVVGSTGYRTVSASFGEICPWTDKPWTQADVALFDSTAEVRVARVDSAVGFFSPTVAALELVIYWTAETRVAYGTSGGFWNIERWFQYTMDTIAATGSWPKVAGTTYWLAWRRLRLEQNPFVIYDPTPMRPDFDVPWTEAAALGHAVWPEAYVADTGVGGRITSMGTATARRAVFGINLDPTAFGQMDVSFPTTGQPYGDVEAADLSIGPVRQRFVAPATAGYRAVRVLFVPGALNSNAVTTVRVLNASTLAQVGGTATLTRESLTEQGTHVGAGSPGDVWAIQLVLSSSAALVSGTAYYVEISGGDQSPVYVDVPEGPLLFPGTPGAPNTFIPQDWFSQLGLGDDDARLIVNVGTGEEYAGNSADLQFSIAQQPASLTGLAVEADEQTMTTTTPDTPTCPTIETMPLAEVHWDASALPDAQFVRYEVERFDPTTGVWSTIARLTSKTATTWWDPDIRFGVAEAYRVRQIAAGEVPSDYTGDETTTLLVEAPGCGLFFTVAEAQQWNMAVLDVYGGGPAEREFRWLDEKVLVPMIGRDYQVAFSPAETRGVAFDRTLLLNAISALVVPSYSTFDPLRDLARAPVSAICVRDHEGNRWYMTMVVPDGSLRQQGEMAYARISLTQVATSAVAYEGTGDVGLIVELLAESGETLLTELGEPIIVEVG